MDPIEQKLTDLHTEFKGYLDKSAEEKQAQGQVLADTQTAVDAIRKKMDDLQKQTDAIDLEYRTRHSADQPREVKSFGSQFTESPEYKAAHAVDMRVAQPVRAMINGGLFDGRKASITTVGVGTGTTGVQMPQRMPGVVGLPMQALRIRDIMAPPVNMTTGNSFDYVRMATRTSSPSPQVEGSAKAESTFTWTSKSDTVKTIAHWTQASKQAIADIPWLRTTIDGELMYGLLLKEESEILAGDGTGQHLNGLITQATAYNTGYNVASDQQLDKLRHAKLQARQAGLATFAPDGIVLNPVDMEKIELIKTEEGGANKGRYIIGDPTQGDLVKYVWGLPVVESDSIASGTFLIGAFSTAARLVDRLQAMIEISYENGTNFTTNMATVLCEERLGMFVSRPEAFITGSL